MSAQFDVFLAQGQSLAAVQQARVDDAKKVAETLLAMNEKWLTSVNDLTNAVERLASGDSGSNTTRRRS